MCVSTSQQEKNGEKANAPTSGGIPSAARLAEPDSHENLSTVEQMIYQGSKAQSCHNIDLTSPELREKAKFGTGNALTALST